MKNEKVIDKIIINGAVFEVVEKTETIYAGKIAYASNLADEPDIGKLLDDYRKSVPKEERIDPEWDVAISIDYWQGGAVPRGLMFAQEVATDKQPEGLDVYKVPSSLYIRLFNDSNAAKLLGKEKCEIWELFGLIKEKIMTENGYKFATNGAQEMEYYNWSKYKSGFAYVPVMCI